MIKTTGAEFKAFYSDPKWWPEGVFHEEAEIIINGEQSDDDTDLYAISDDAKISLKNGFVTNENGDDLGSFENFFRKWRNKQKTMIIVAKVSRDKLDDVISAIKAAGGRVVK